MAPTWAIPPSTKLQARAYSYSTAASVNRWPGFGSLPTATLQQNIPMYPQGGIGHSTCSTWIPLKCRFTTGRSRVPRTASNVFCTTGATTSSRAQVFARPGPVGKDARLPVEIPFARLVQHLQGVFEVAGLAFTGNAQFPFRPESPGIPLMRRSERECLCCRVDRPQAFPAPGVVFDVHQLNVAGIVVRLDGAGHARCDRRVLRRQRIDCACRSRLSSTTEPGRRGWAFLPARRAGP